MDNIYIKAMEIGYTNPDGLTYKELKESVENELGINFTYTIERAFIKWVLDSFDSVYDTDNTKTEVIRNSLSYLREPDRLDPSYQRTYNNLENNTLSIKGSIVKQYIDYLELKESRETARDAKESAKIANGLASKSVKLALWALILSGAFGLISAIVGIWSVTSSSKPIEPPYDVKIIEDKSGVKELQRENDSLRNEIYEANILIDSYESKS